MSKSPLPDRTSTEAADLLVQSAFTVMALVSQVATEHDVSLTLMRVLAILRDHEPKINELAAHLGLERSSVSGLVDRAVKKGLVRRETSGEDARAVRLSLTAQGHRLADEAAARITGLLDPMTSRLTSAERAQLAVLLARLWS